MFGPLYLVLDPVKSVILEEMTGSSGFIIKVRGNSLFACSV